MFVEYSCELKSKKKKTFLKSNFNLIQFYKTLEFGKTLNSPGTMLWKNVRFKNCLQVIWRTQLSLLQR